MQQPFPSDEPPRNILSAGKTLEHTARMRWQHLSEDDATCCNSYPVPPELTFGSICTGSGFDHWINAASQVAMEAQGHHVSFKCLFACEIFPKKQLWLRRFLPSYACIFADCKTLASGHSPCWQHGRKADQTEPSGKKASERKCQVPSVDLFAASRAVKISADSIEARRVHALLCSMLDRPNRALH